MELEPKDPVIQFRSPRFSYLWPNCSVCGQTAYQIATITSFGVERETPLCSRHFVDVCVEVPRLTRSN